MGGDHAEWRARVPQGGSDGGVGWRNSKFEMRPAVAGSRMCGKMRNSENAPRWRADAGRGRETDVLARGIGISELRPLVLLAPRAREGQWCLSEITMQTITADVLID